MKSRIVLLSAFVTPFRSGAEAMVEEVSALLQDQFDLTIVTARLRKDLPMEDRLSSGVKVVRVGLGLPVDKWLFPLLGALKAVQLKPDLIHAVLESFAGLALVLCRILSPHTKRILTCQSTNTALLLKSMHHAATKITCISSVLMKRAETFGRRDCILIPNGIPYDAIHAASVRSRKAPGRVLFVGRLEPMKGIDTLLQAFHQTEEGELHIVGDGSLRQSLETKVRQLGLQEKVRFLGKLTGAALLKEYAEAEVFCGLSRSEALGNVFLEAQAAGCGIVATNVGGIPDVVLDGKTGTLVPVDDATASARAIRELLNDHPLRVRFTHAAVTHAKAYDWGGIAGQYATVYREMVF